MSNQSTSSSSRHRTSGTSHRSCKGDDISVEVERRRQEGYTHSHDLDSVLLGQFLQEHLAHEQSPSPHFLQDSPQLGRA